MTESRQAGLKACATTDCERCQGAGVVDRRCEANRGRVRLVLPAGRGRERSADHLRVPPAGSERGQRRVRRDLQQQRRRPHRRGRRDRATASRPPTAWRGARPERDGHPGSAVTTSASTRSATRSASYPAGNGTTATGDATYTTDIPDNAGLALFNTSVAADFTLANRLDAVGSTSEANTLYKEGAGYPALTPFSIDYAFTRRLPGGCTGSSGGSLQQRAVDPDDSRPARQPGARTPTTTPPTSSSWTPTAPVPARASGWARPGRRTSTSPIASDDFALTASTLDSCRLPNASPNYVRAGGASAGRRTTSCLHACRRRTRRSARSTSGRRSPTTRAADITRLRFRVVDITTFPSHLRCGRPSADHLERRCRHGRPAGLRHRYEQRHGARHDAGGCLPVSRTDPASTGRCRSARSRSARRWRPGQSVDVRFVLGVQQMGAARFCVAAETAPRRRRPRRCSVSSVPPRARSGRRSQTFSNSGAITIQPRTAPPHPTRRGLP